jgi:hypothetical protein
MAGDMASLVGRQPDNGIGDLLRLPDPPHRDEGSVVMRFAAHTFRQERSLNRAAPTAFTQTFFVA